MKNKKKKSAAPMPDLIEQAGRSADKKTELTPKAKRKRTIKLAVGAVVIVAVVAGLLLALIRIIHKDPGFYTVETNQDESAPLYANGFTFTYYFTGKSGEIRAKQLELKNAYSSSLSRIYKLLDPVNTYEGYINLAYINAHLGEDIELDQDLYGVLTAAAALYEQGVFNPFAGALHEEWMTVNYLTESEDSDPLVVPYMAERFALITDAVNDAGNFSFRVVDPGRRVVNFNVSSGYLELAEANEFSSAILNLGWLRTAFELDYVCRMLEKAGYNAGYFTTAGGVSAAMSALPEGGYLINSLEDRTPVRACSVDMAGGSACCSLRSFGTNDSIEYYRIATETGEALRHPHYSFRTGELYDVLLSASIIAYDGDIVGACVAAHELFACRSADEVREAASGLASGERMVAYILRGTPYDVFVDNAHSAKLVPLSTAVTVKSY